MNQHRTVERGGGLRDYKEYVLEYIYSLNSKIDIFVGYYLKREEREKRDRERGKREKRIQRFYLVRLRGNCKKGRGNRSR